MADEISSDPIRYTILRSFCGDNIFDRPLTFNNIFLQYCYLSLCIFGWLTLHFPVTFRVDNPSFKKVISLLTNFEQIDLIFIFILFACLFL